MVEWINILWNAQTVKQFTLRMNECVDMDKSHKFNGEQSKPDWYVQEYILFLILFI